MKLIITVVRNFYMRHTGYVNAQWLSAIYKYNTDESRLILRAPFFRKGKQ